MLMLTPLSLVHQIMLPLAMSQWQSCRKPCLKQHWQSATITTQTQKRKKEVKMGGFERKFDIFLFPNIILLTYHFCSRIKMWMLLPTESDCVRGWSHLNGVVTLFTFNGSNSSDITASHPGHRRMFNSLGTYIISIASLKGWCNGVGKWVM